MATNRTHHVLCVACGIAATTLYTYPEKRCGVTNTARDRAGVVHHMTCTNPPGSAQCQSGTHYDQFLQMVFEIAPSVRADRSGETRRA